MELTFLAFVFFIFVAITVAKGVRIVPQGEEWVVERLGKYHTTMLPGLHLLIPYIDRVGYKVPTKDLILDIPQQEVITKDNAVLVVNAIAFVKVTDTQNAVYGVTSFELAIVNIIQTTLRSIVGEMELDQALSSREQIKVRLKESISDDVADWGLTLKSVEIQDIKPSPSMQDSMERQAARRTGAQSHRHQGRGRQAGRHPGSRSPPRSRQARRPGADRAGAGRGGSHQAGDRIDPGPGISRLLPARRKIHPGHA